MVIFHSCVSHYQAGYSPIDGHFIGNFCPSIPSIPSIPATSRGYVTGVARSVPEVFVACGEHGEEGDAAASGIFLGVHQEMRGFHQKKNGGGYHDGHFVPHSNTGMSLMSEG